MPSPQAHANLATMCRAKIIPYSEKDFFDLENLSVSPPRKCDRCKKLKTDDEKETQFFLQCVQYELNKLSESIMPQLLKNYNEAKQLVE